MPLLLHLRARACTAAARHGKTNADKKAYRKLCRAGKMGMRGWADQIRSPGDVCSFVEVAKNHHQSNMLLMLIT
jgi:hypothetical protein